MWGKGAAAGKKRGSLQEGIKDPTTGQRDLGRDKGTKGHIEGRGRNRQAWGTIKKLRRGENIAVLKRMNIHSTHSNTQAIPFP